MTTAAWTFFYGYALGLTAGATLGVNLLAWRQSRNLDHILTEARAADARHAEANAKKEVER